MPTLRILRSVIQTSSPKSKERSPGSIRQKFELIQEIMHVIVTCLKRIEQIVTEQK